MARTVLDSSALLAFINGEPGGGEVATLLAEGAISAVNFAEVVSKLVARGASPTRASEMLKIADLTVIDFDRSQAEATGAMIPITKKLGLSLGDHACLALAAREGVPAVTADQAWQSVGRSIGVEIQIIR